MTPAVGFDLDMTLIDSRPGIAATYRALSARTGVHVDADLVVSRLGPPLRSELRQWFPPADVEGAVDLVTSKIGRLAALHLSHLQLAADELAGDRFAEGKAAAIKEYGVRWFVGDHVGDMVAATAAGVPGIGVTTGPCSAGELTEAGATYVIGDLTAFPALLRRIAVGSAGAGR